MTVFIEHLEFYVDFCLFTLNIGFLLFISIFGCNLVFLKIIHFKKHFLFKRKLKINISELVQINSHSAVVYLLNWIAYFI